MKRLLFAGFILAAILAASAQAVSSARAPLVLAFYYDWFDENTWKPSQLPDMPAITYTSRDPGTIARQIQQARSAGIDAFVVSWWGVGNPTDQNFKLLLDQARAANFKVAIDFEITSPFYRSRTDVVNSLKTLLATHVNNPAYLTVDGKPVIFFWRQQNYSVEVWKEIRNALDPQHRTLWISEGIDTRYLDVFDGHHLYSVGWSKNVAADLNKYASRVRAYGPDKIWVATTMPGNDDTRTKRAGSYKRDRQGGEFYRQTWRAAIGTKPDWTIITSYNEWFEGTMIEPSVSYGDLYLNITREFATLWKAGAQPPVPTEKPAATKAPTVAPTPTRTATLIPGALAGVVTDTVRVRAEPSTSSAVLGRLPEGATVAVLARSEDGEWWQIAYPNASKRGWISAEYTAVKGRTVSRSVVAPAVATVTPTPTPEPASEPTTHEVDETALGPVSPAFDISSIIQATPTPVAPGSWLKSILPFLP